MSQTRTKGAPVAKHRTAKTVPPRLPYKGRPIYTDEDRKKMRPTMPPETDWVNELLGKK